MRKTFYECKHEGVSITFGWCNDIFQSLVTGHEVRTYTPPVVWKCCGCGATASIAEDQIRPLPGDWKPPTEQLPESQGGAS